MSRFYNIICPNCNFITRVEYTTTDSFEWSGKLNVSNRELYHYYDQDSYSDGMERQVFYYEYDWDLALICQRCCQDIDDHGYVYGFNAFNQEGAIVDTSNLNQSFRLFSAHCTSCNLYSEVITDCYVTLQQEGYLCIDEHQQLIWVRMKTEEYIEYASYQYSCCGKEISEDRLSQLRIDV
ncbi:MAG: hypothetical protein OEW48_04840 [Phycisphaerae bacterium]|nr:hypothetical protein [Phycisphaerae bacterium]